MSLCAKDTGAMIDRQLYTHSIAADASGAKPARVDLCTCEPAFDCPGGVMVHSGLRGVLTPLYTRMQSGWCCR